MASVGAGPQSRALLQVRGVCKAFARVPAVVDAGLDLHAGECLGLVGGNGAGKSTLLRVITGAHRADAGEVLLDGRPIHTLGPAAVARAGVACIYQELSLVPQLSVRENLLLGWEQSFWPRRLEESQAVGAVLRRLRADLDPEAEVGRLDLAARQRVEIARALLRQARVLILDEPTTALTPAEAAALFTVLDDLRSQGLGLIFVSHRLEEVMAHTQRLCVMRDGRSLGSWSTTEVDRQRLIELMVGRPLSAEFPPRAKEHAPGPAVLSAIDLGAGRLRGIQLEVRQGEVLGLGGLAGAGRTELAHLLAGLDSPTQGRLLLDGEPVSFPSPRAAIARGVCLLTEDRQREGLVPLMSARENFSLPLLDRWSRLGWLQGGEESRRFAALVEQLGIRLAGPGQLARELSGGNQQKLLLARWLERGPRVLILDEPTRGVDVGTKAEIYRLVHRLVEEGMALVLISSDLPELLALSDRILVLREGQVSGELAASACTAEAVMALAAG